MSCKLNHKEALLNSREFLIEQQAIDKLSTILNLQKFEEVNSTLSNDAFNAYGVEGNLWSEKSGRAVPNKSVLKSIDEKRKELGIYDSKEAAIVKSFLENNTDIKLQLESTKKSIAFVDNTGIISNYTVFNNSGENIGTIDVEESNDAVFIFPKIKDEYQRKGYGKSIYKYIASSTNKTLYSDVELSKGGKKLWESLVRDNLAFKNEDGVYEFISQPDLDSVEDFVEEVDYTNQDFIEDRNSIKLQNQLLSDELNLESFDEMFPDMDYLSGAEKLILIKAIEDGKFSISCTI